MTTYTVESYQEFDRRHGGNPLHVGNRFLWPSGAGCSADDRERRHEPPIDPIVRLRFRQAYAREWVKQWENAFARCKQDAAANPTDAYVAELIRLKREVEKARTALMAIETELAAAVDASPEGQMRKRAVELDRRQQEERSANKTQIMNIEI